MAFSDTDEYQILCDELKSARSLFKNVSFEAQQIVVENYMTLVAS